MEQSELLRHVVSALEKLGLRYLVTGSVVTIFFGEPRLTNDIDIVVDLPEERIKAFRDEFPEADMLDRDSHLGPIRHGIPFQYQFPSQLHRLTLCGQPLPTED